MATKKSKRHKGKEKTEHKQPYSGPFQPNQYSKIDAQKHVMSIIGHSPTQDTFTPLSESDDYFPSEEELSSQVLEERRSPTANKKLALKIGLYILWVILGAGVIAAIGLFYNHSLQINKTESDVESLTKDVEANTKDINDLKTDKKLFEYQLNELKKDSSR